MNLPAWTYDSDPVEHALNLQMLLTISQEPANGGPWLTGAFPPQRGDFSFYIPAASTNPDVRVYWDGTNVLIVCGPMTTLAQMQGFVTSLFAGYSSIGPTGFNTFIAGACNVVTDRMIAARIPLAGAVIRLVGYSFGGAVVEALWKYLLAYLPARLEGYSYGAPRCAEGWGTIREGGYHFVRNFIYNDPVVNAPPKPDEGPLFYVGNLSAFNQGMASQNQPCNGLAIDNAGNVQAAMYRATIANSPYTGLQAWLLSFITGATSPHALQNYIGAWGLAQQIVPPQNVDVPAEQLPGPVDLPPIQRRQVIAAAVQAQGQIVGGNVPNAAREIIAAQNLQGALKFRKATVGGIRFISYGGQVVTVCPNKRVQKELCRRLNRDVSDLVDLGS